MNLKKEIVTALAAAFYWWAVAFFALYVAYFNYILSAIIFGLMWFPYVKFIKWVWSLE